MVNANQIRSVFGNFSLKDDLEYLKNNTGGGGIPEDFEEKLSVLEESYDRLLNIVVEHVECSLEPIQAYNESLPPSDRLDNIETNMRELERIVQEHIS